VDIILIIGSPASGKSTYAKKYIAKGYFYLNRDLENTSMTDILKLAEKAILENKKIVLDNTFPTIESRKPFIELAKKYKKTIKCDWVATSTEDAQINALNRMYDRYSEIFLDPKAIQNHSQAKKDPNIFPSAALFKYRKEFEKPNIKEGFNDLQKFEFQRLPSINTNKALILDYDGTLRDVKAGSKYKYPISKDEIEILPNRTKILKQYLSKGYKLIGISNQSGVAKKHLTKEQAQECFDYTNKLLGLDIDVYFCHHSIPPLTCYCRKPQSGLGVYIIRKYNLNPKDCIFVGDMTSDKTFAQRLGFQYIDSQTFFNK